MEEMRGARYVRRDEGCSQLGVHHSPPTPSCVPIWKLSESCPFGFLWRLRYVGMVDEVIDHWLLY